MFFLGIGWFGFTWDTNYNVLGESQVCVAEGYLMRLDEMRWAVTKHRYLTTWQRERAGKGADGLNTAVAHCFLWWCVARLFAR